MSTGQCERLAAAVRTAAAADTRVLVLRGGPSFANGIHLNVIHAAARPEAEAWRNIQAIDDVCREIITCTGQLVVASVGGNAGAGGVMLALGADRVLVRAGVVFNPHYRTIGLYGGDAHQCLGPGGDHRGGRRGRVQLRRAVGARRGRVGSGRPGSARPTQSATVSSGPPTGLTRTPASSERSGQSVGAQLISGG